MKLKICGVQNETMLKCCLDSLVDFIGLNFIPSSRRYVIDDVFLDEFSTRGDTKFVGVFQDQPADFIRDKIFAKNLDLVQFHGEESVAFCQDFNIPIIKSFSLSAESDLNTLRKYCGKVSTILLDGPRPGSGEAANFKFLHQAVEICEKLHQPYAIAGGINPKNFAKFLSAFPRADFFDLASGVENPTGTFDPKLLSDLVSQSHNI